MNETAHQPQPAPAATLPFADRINLVSTQDPFRWLAAGWRDLCRAPGVSLGLGLLFVAAGFAIVAGLDYLDQEHLIAPLASGFLIVAPALTVGFYAISRDLENGVRPGFTRALFAWRANPGPLLGFGLGLVLFLIVWIRLAVVIFALSFPYQQLSLQSMVDTALFTLDGNLFLAFGTAVGFVMASIAFTVSVMAVPMMVEGKADIVRAVIISVVAVLLNRPAMIVWAGLIALFTFGGLLTAFVGLAVTLPLIGHASWHAYRAVVKRAP
ncbi:MAG: DUF2189 domain-containing protein [Azospirillum sp.]|nr:DUF2189 domain-containing protein [Azospirillum sp.]